VDRLWQYRRLGNPARYDETWDPYHTCYGHNPDNLQPFSSLFEEPPSEGPSEAPNGAPGGRAEEAQGEAKVRVRKEGGAPSEEQREGSKVKGGSEARRPATRLFRPYTNRELYEALHPAGRRLPYVYENFKWGHCEKLGYHMTNA